MDEKEVRRVVKDYSDMIKRISYNYLQHTYDCDDICQTVFLKFLTGNISFESREHEKAWNDVGNLRRMHFMLMVVFGFYQE